MPSSWFDTPLTGVSVVTCLMHAAGCIYSFFIVPFSLILITTKQSPPLGEAGWRSLHLGEAGWGSLHHNFPSVHDVESALRMLHTVPLQVEHLLSSFCFSHLASLMPVASSLKFNAMREEAFSTSVSTSWNLKYARNSFILVCPVEYQNWLS